MKKRVLSILMAPAPAMSLLPGAVLAAAGHWAQSAVDTLTPQPPCPGRTPLQIF